MIIIILNKAKNEIKEELRRYPNLETGGVLFGFYVLGWCLISCASSSGNNSKHEKCRFEMNMDFAQKEAERIISNSVFRCKVVGIWHSHNNMGSHFSHEDIETNIAYTELNRFGMISILVTKSDFGNILNCYHVKMKRNSNSIKCECKYRYIL